MAKIPAKQPYLFISVFALLLMAALFFIQSRSFESIRDLQKGNEMAATTLRVNTSLQEIINDINIIESSLIKSAAIAPPKHIRDTIRMMNDEVQKINVATSSQGTSSSIVELTDLIDRKSKLFNRILDTIAPVNASDFIYTKGNYALNDSIYFTAQKIQLGLEKNLEETVNKNSVASARVLSTSRVLTLVALAAILILATLIIRHLSRNLRLIKELDYEKQKTQEAANIKAQFLANMSHEIRTPVNAIVGFTNLLQKTELDKKQEEFVDLIKTSGGNLINIVNDILDISKIEAGMIQFQKRDFDIRETVSQLERMFKPAMESKHLDFKCTVDENVPAIINGDDERLRQVLANLLSNALKFTSTGSISFSVSANDFNEKMVSLKFEVADTGIGIKADKLQSIFERFEQADLETTRNYGGTGLGLSIVKKLLELQQGTIKVNSKPGAGSQFIVILDFSLPLSVRNDRKAYATASNKKVIRFKNSPSILFAEDNKMNQILLQHIFAENKLEHTLAVDGKEAMELLRKRKFDIVLMDIQMPGFDGYTVTRWLRTELKSSVPVIAITAHVLPGEIEKCMQAGINDYLPKPIIEEDLLNKLGKFLPHEIIEPNKYINVNNIPDDLASSKPFVKTLLKQFILQYPKEVEDLFNAANERDHEKMKRISHSLRGTISAVDANSHLLHHLEMVAETEWNDEEEREIINSVKELYEKRNFVVEDVKYQLTSIA